MKLHEKVKDLEEKYDVMVHAYENYTIQCPFWDLRDGKSCVYDENGRCEFDVCPGNGDAWCRDIIENVI